MVDHQPSKRASETRSRNPFSQQRIESLAYRFPDGADWESNLARLKELNFRALVVGSFGTGKSTLLRELQSRLLGRRSVVHRPISEPIPTQTSAKCSISETICRVILLDVPRVEAGHCSISRLRVGSRKQQRAAIADQLSDLDSGSLLLVDGIERLTWLDRQRLVQQTAARARVAGLVVIVHRRHHLLRLPIWIETRPTEALLIELVDELLAAQPETIRSFIHQRGLELANQNPHNIRATLRHLFDEWDLIQRTR